MSAFKLISQGSPVQWLVDSLERQPELWGQNRLRTLTPGSPHKQADDIWLRFNKIPDAIEDWDELESFNYPAYDDLLEAKKLVRWLACRMDAERIGRVLITRLKPGSVITPHCDIEQYSTYYDRFHIVLAADEGSVFHCGDEHAVMKRGECWSFDNRLLHSVENKGATDRLHLIVDLRLAEGIF
jgi:hypothetical protein